MYDFYVHSFYRKELVDRGSLVDISRMLFGIYPYLSIESCAITRDLYNEIISSKSEAENYEDNLIKHMISIIMKAISTYKSKITCKEYFYAPLNYNGIDLIVAYSSELYSSDDTKNMDCLTFMFKEQQGE